MEATLVVAEAPRSRSQKLLEATLVVAKAHRSINLVVVVAETASS